MRRLAAIAAAGLALAAGSTARAQDRLVLEGEAGLGFLGVNENGSKLDATGLHIAGSIGGYLSPRSALLVTAGLTTGKYEVTDAFPENPSGNLTELYLGVGFRYWITPNFWADADVSTARTVIEQLGFVEKETFSGARFGLTGGYIFYRGESINIDGRAGVGGGGYQDQVGTASLWLGVGIATP